MPNITPENLWAYATVAVGIVLLVVRQLPNLFGPIGKTVREWTDGRRRTQTLATRADITELQEQVQGLTSALTEYREKARIHSVWDRKVYREMQKAGLDIEFPPDLF